ncbi:MAG: polyprenyl synthetase family protein [Clostridiales bacterium]|nr:polyprenyl synthetase family protein [Clostridiales bacterium]
MKMNDQYSKQLSGYKEQIDRRLEGYLSGITLPQEPLLEAMRYTLLNAGKRLRGIMTLEFCRVSGKPAALALDLACGVEMMHAYSLIHDDLPVMDNDDYRRGKLSNHKVFGEWQALLAGDALQTEAFNAVLRAKLPPESVVIAASVLGSASGFEGMCGGQYLDIVNEDKTLSLDEVSTIHSLKTAALIMAACVMGCAAAGSTEEQALAAAKYGASVGIAFQIRDDVLDLEGIFEELGKLSGSDTKNGKSTFATLLGTDRCEEIIQKETQTAKAAVDGVYADTGFLHWLADKMAGRTK